MGEPLTDDEVRTILLSTNEEVRKPFLQYFGAEIGTFVSNFTSAYNRMQKMAPRVPYDRRSAWVDEFLFTAFNSLLTSFYLLISGFNIPSGNLMRHYGEAVAMALLLSHRQIDTFDLIDNDPQKLSVHKSLDLVKKKRNARLLGIDGPNWQKFQGIMSFYDQYSHPSAFAVASSHSFSLPGHRQIGGEFDAAKIEAYRKEIGLRISACERLYETVEVVESHLLNSKPPN